MPLIFAPESGEAIIGSERIFFVPVGGDGSVRVEGRPGSTIRPLRFGERTRLLLDARQADEPLAFCADLLIHAATNSPADALSPGEKALALVLAGGNIEAPSLTRTVAVVAEATGWPQEIINAKAAFEIDRMAFDLTAQNAGWNRIVFPRQGADDVDAIIGELTTVLLNRTDEAMIRFEEDGLFPIAVPEESEVRIREREGQPAPAESFPKEPPFFPRGPAEFPPRQFAGYFRTPAPLPGASSSRSLIGGTVSLPDQYPEPGVSIPLPLAEDRPSPNGETPNLNSWRHSDPPQGSGLSDRSEKESTGGFLRKSRKEGWSPAEERKPKSRIFPEKTRNSGLEVPQPEGKGFDLPEAAFLTKGESAAGVLDRSPLQKPELETFPKGNSPRPERRNPFRQALFIPGNRTGRRVERDQTETGMEQGRFQADYGEERVSFPDLAAEGVSPSPGPRKIPKMPGGGLAVPAALPSSAKADRNREKEALSTPDELDVAGLADEIGRMLAAEADLRGID